MTAYDIPLSKDTLLSTYENANYTNTYGAEIIVRTRSPNGGMRPPT